MNREIGLVSCVKTKRGEPATPKDFYTSDYFQKMRSCVEQYRDEWWILSAKHGLLYPDAQPIESYDETLSDARVIKKREWAERINKELDEEGLLSDDVTLVFYVCKDYYEKLVLLIEDTGTSIEILTKRLYIGERKCGARSNYD